jgi:YD repeat-containing protein
LSSLSRSGNGSSTSVSYQYDAIGKLTSKSDYASNYQYRTNSHQLASVTLPSGKSQSYTHDANGNVTTRGNALALAYDIDNLPRTISQDTRVANFYTAPGGRYLQRLNSRDTWYLGKAYEREVNAGQISTERYYLTSRKWILERMRSGRPIIDIGTDAARRTPSIFYQMEQHMLKNYQKLHPGSLEIKTP